MAIRKKEEKKFDDFLGHSPAVTMAILSLKSQVFCLIEQGLQEQDNNVRKGKAYMRKI